MFLFCEAAVTNYHKLDDLKQQRFILLKFWRLKGQNLVGLPSLCEVLGENPFLASSSFSELSQHSWVCDHTPTVPASILISPPLLCISPPTLFALSQKHLWYHLGSTWIIQGKLRIFNLFAKTFFPPR